MSFFWPEALDFSHDRASWCSNPCTRVIAHFKQGPATSAEALLPDLPRVPVIDAVDVGPVETDPVNQRVLLRVRSSDASLFSFRVRIVHYELDSKGSWIRIHRLFESYSPNPNITITGLRSGRYYSFQVAAVNEVDEGPYSNDFPDRQGVLVGARVVTIEPRVPIDRPALAADTCLAVEQEGLDVVDRAPNWVSWQVKVSISALPRSQERPAIIEFSDGADTFRCLEFELNATNPLVAYCKIPCMSSQQSTNLSVSVWDSNSITKIADGHLFHEAMSDTSCNRYVPRTPVFCPLEVGRCLPAAGEDGTSATACRACKDHDTPKTYQVSPTLCTGFPCSSDLLWCPLRQGQASACLKGTCASGCHELSVARNHSAGGRFCAVPCKLTSLPALIRAADFQVAPGSSTMLLCIEGFKPVWGSGETRFHCPSENTFELHDASTLQFAECAPQCGPGTLNLGTFGRLPYGILRRGEEIQASCPTGGTVRLRCNETSQIDVLLTNCQACGSTVFQACENLLQASGCRNTFHVSHASFASYFWM